MLINYIILYSVLYIFCLFKACELTNGQKQGVCNIGSEVPEAPATRTRLPGGATTASFAGAAARHESREALAGGLKVLLRALVSRSGAGGAANMPYP